MIVELTPYWPNPHPFHTTEEMGRSLRARRRARKARKRERVDEINAKADVVHAQIEALQNAMIENVGGIIDGVDVRTGTHKGDPKIVEQELLRDQLAIQADAQQVKAASQVKMLLIGGVCVVGMVAILKKNKTPKGAK